MSSTTASVSTDSGPAFLGRREIEILRKFSTPTVANAVENLLGFKPVGSFTTRGVGCHFPEFGVMAGYACTATTISTQPRRAPRHFPRKDYWEYISQSPEPRVIVMQELSDSPMGAFWGEVNANIHRRLRCEGVLTNGLVRDMEEVRALGFQFFSGGIGVSHAFAHLEDYDRPVNVFGMTVRSNDLIHADQHGAVIIPHAVAGKVAAACEQLMSDETVMIKLCQSDEFTLEALDALISPEY